MEFITVTSSDGHVEILGKWWEILVVAEIGYAPKRCSDIGCSGSEVDDFIWGEAVKSRGKHFPSSVEIEISWKS